MKEDKKTRRELAVKKAKRKKLIIIIAASAVVLALVALIVISTFNSANTIEYSDAYGQSFLLRPNGQFIARTFHGNTFGGTYDTFENGYLITYSGTTGIVWVEGDTLYLPTEWDDGHGHGNALTLR